MSLADSSLHESFVADSTGRNYKSVMESLDKRCKNIRFALADFGHNVQALAK